MASRFAASTTTPKRAACADRGYTPGVGQSIWRLIGCLAVTGSVRPQPLQLPPLRGHRTLRPLPLPAWHSFSATHCARADARGVFVVGGTTRGDWGGCGEGRVWGRARPSLRRLSQGCGAVAPSGSTSSTAHGRSCRPWSPIAAAPPSAAWKECATTGQKRHTHIHAHTYTDAHEDIHTHTYICMHVHTHTRTRTRAHTQKPIHRSSPSLSLLPSLHLPSILIPFNCALSAPAPHAHRMLTWWRN